MFCLPKFCDSKVIRDVFVVLFCKSYFWLANAVMNAFCVYNLF